MDPKTDPRMQHPPQLPNRPPRPRPDPRYQDPRPYKKWMFEVWYPGCHSDVGGSYLPRNDKKWHMQFLTLRDMHKAMLKARVPIDTPQFYLDGDMLRHYEEYCGFRQDKDYAQHLERNPAQYIQWFETDEYMARFYGPDDHPELVNRGVSPGLVAFMQSGGGMGYMPPPPQQRPPPHASWTPRLLAMQPREKNPALQALLAGWIHDSASETPGASILGEARPADGHGRLRLQRQVIPAGAQSAYRPGVPVRNEHRPPRPTY